MTERGRRFSSRLGAIVPGAQTNRVACIRLPDEGLRFFRQKTAALKGETASGSGRKVGVIIGVDRAQIPLGGDVQPDRREHRFTEVPAQHPDRAIFVAVVDVSGSGCGNALVHEMAHVVKQARGDHRVSGVVLLCEQRALQRVLELSHRLFAVEAAASGHVNDRQVIDERTVHVR